MANTSYCPKGYHNVTPSLAYKGAEQAITWYKNVFGAEERMRMDGPDKKIIHAELKLGDSVIFLAEENPAYKVKSPKSTNGNSITLHLYVEDVDDIIKKAVQNGATLLMAPMDMFYGDRVGNIEDPFGYSWTLATHVKDVSGEEMEREAKKVFEQPA